MAKFPHILNERLWFPDPREAVSIGPYEGIVAVGGDLSVERLLLAYRSGMFPWSGRPITWWSPDPRAVFELENFHIPRSLKRRLEEDSFQVTFNTAFEAVIDACAAPGPNRGTTWISPEIREAYVALFKTGHAHSVEVWHEGALAGGVYGVATRGLFAGESMFHRVSDASKVGLCHLVAHLKERDYALFDIQMVTPVTLQLGAKEISREDYLARLEKAVSIERSFIGNP